MKEITDIAARRGIRFDEGIIGMSLGKAESFPYSMKSSYQLDVENRRRNEGDLFGGTIVQLGRSLSVPTPVTERLCQEIEERPSGTV